MHNPVVDFVKSKYEELLRFKAFYPIPLEMLGIIETIFPNVETIIELYLTNEKFLNAIKEKYPEKVVIGEVKYVSITNYLKKILNPNIILCKDVIMDETPKIVVMNPPYQKPKNNDETNGSIGIWDVMVLNAFKLLKDGDYLFAITPNSWAGLGKTKKIIFDGLMKKYQTIAINLNGNEYFNINNDNGCFLIQKKLNDGTFLTKVTLKDGSVKEVNLKNMQDFPLHMNKNNISILEKVKNKPSLKIEIHRHGSHITDNPFCVQAKEGVFKKLMYVDKTNMLGEIFNGCSQFCMFELKTFSEEEKEIIKMQIKSPLYEYLFTIYGGQGKSSFSKNGTLQKIPIIGLKELGISVALSQEDFNAALFNYYGFNENEIKVIVGEIK